MKCDHCLIETRNYFCNKCFKFYCSKCLPIAHLTNAKGCHHSAIRLCDECEKVGSQFICHNCDQYLCAECDKTIHNKGKRAIHQREICTDFSTIEFNKIDTICYLSSDYVQSTPISVKDNEFERVLKSNGLPSNKVIKITPDNYHHNENDVFSINADLQDFHQILKVNKNIKQCLIFDCHDIFVNQLRTIYSVHQIQFKFFQPETTFGCDNEKTADSSNFNLGQGSTADLSMASNNSMISNNNKSSVSDNDSFPCGDNSPLNGNYLEALNQMTNQQKDNLCGIPFSH